MSHFHFPVGAPKFAGIGFRETGGFVVGIDDRAEAGDGGAGTEGGGQAPDAGGFGVGEGEAQLVEDIGPPGADVDAEGFVGVGLGLGEHADELAFCGLEEGFVWRRDCFSMTVLLEIASVILGGEPGL